MPLVFMSLSSDAILRALRARPATAARCARSSSSTSVNSRLRRIGASGTALFAWQYASTSVDLVFGSAGDVAGSRSVSASTGKKPIVAPYSGAMLAIVARSGSDSASQARAEELDELADDAVLAQHLRDGQHQVGRGRALRQLARSAGSRRLPA